MMRSFAALRRVDPGFDPRGVVTLEVSRDGTRAGRARPPRGRSTARSWSGSPRCRASRGGRHQPRPDRGRHLGLAVRVEGRPARAPGESPSAAYRAVLPGYFRDDAAADRARPRHRRDRRRRRSRRRRRQRVHGAAAAGPARIRSAAASRSDDRAAGLTVVGVVEGRGPRGLGRRRPTTRSTCRSCRRGVCSTSPIPRRPTSTFVVRAGGDPAALAPALRAAVRSIDPTLPVSAV